HYLTDFKEIFEKNYADNKVSAQDTIDEMQGLKLPFKSSLAKTSYTISVIPARCSGWEFVITFSNKNHYHYGNFLIFSADLYPSTGNKSTRRSIFDNSKSVSLQFDDEKYQMILNGKNVRFFDSLIEILSSENNQQLLFSQHMRQRLALQTFILQAK